MKKIILLLVGFSLFNFAGLPAASDAQNKAKYEKRYQDPLLEAMSVAREKEQAALDEAPHLLQVFEIDGPHLGQLDLLAAQAVYFRFVIGSGGEAPTGVGVVLGQRRKVKERLAGGR